MIYDASACGRSVRVEVRAAAAEGRYTVRVDGREVEVDVRDSGPHTMSLIVDGRSHEVAIERVEGGYRVFLRGEVLDVGLVSGARGAVAPASWCVSWSARDRRWERARGSWSWKP
jgi:hypothetical protein